MTKKSKIKERNIRESANNKIFGDPIPKHRKRNQSGIRRVSIEGKVYWEARKNRSDNSRKRKL